MNDEIGLDKSRRDARVNLTCVAEAIAYTMSLDRALRVVVEEWSGTRQNHARINHPNGEFVDLYIDQIRRLYERL